MSALYAWLRRHPRLVDGLLAAALAFGGIVTAFGLRHYLVIPVTVALTVPVIFRRAHPVAAFWAAMTVGAIQVVTWSRPVPPDLAILVLLYTLAAYTTRRKSVIGLAACLLGSVAELGELYRHLLRYGVGNWLMIGAVLLAGPSLLAWLLGDAMRYRRAYYVDLEERAARLERDRDVQAQMAAAAERARIARELHDVVAHNVSVMVVQADGAAYALDSSPERTRQALAAIAATGRQALAEMRVMLGVLRKSDETAPPPETKLATTPAATPAAATVAPAQGESAATAFDAPFPSVPTAVTAAPAPGPADDQPGNRTADPSAAGQIPDLAPIPGIGQLDELLDQARAAGLGVSCKIEGTARPLPGGTELAAYRIIQESLTNTRKHAGRGAWASVGLRYQQDAIEVTVTDNGLGAAAPCDGAGHGLTGMRERVALYGGTLAVGPLAAGGFGVRAVLPVTPPQAGAA